MKNIIPVVAACITDRNTVPEGFSFLLHEKNEPRNPELIGKWEYPGGMMDHGESPEVTLRREIREELGKEIIIGRLIHAQTNIYEDGRHYLVLFYHCLLPEQSPMAPGCKWFSYRELITLEEGLATLPGTLEVAGLCVEHCRAWARKR